MFGDITHFWITFFGGWSIVLAVSGISLLLRTVEIRKYRIVLALVVSVMGLSVFFNQFIADIVGNQGIMMQLNSLNSEERFQIIIATSIFMFILAVAEYILHQIVKKRKQNMVTANTIKESLDALPDGICFSMPDGTPLLVNDKMHAISHELFGHVVMNANICDRKLHHLDSKDNILLLSNHSGYLVQTNQEVWNIQQYLHDKIRETVSVNVTEEYRLTQEIKNRNLRLEEVNRKLKEYISKVDELTREKEILAAKIKVHDDIGRALLSFRNYLSSDTKNREDLIAHWKQNIAIMKGEAEQNADPSDWENLMNAAKSVGVRIVLKGKLPREKQIRNTVIHVIHECLNNTVRHANGSLLKVDIEDKKGIFRMEISNDGRPPRGKIKESGGLANLRKSIEMAGGTMKIESLPKFLLKVRMPKGVR